MNLLKAGFGRADITPPLGIGLAGYYVARKAETVLDPLTVSALALEAGEARVLLISTEGATDRENYRGVVWEGRYPAPV